MEASAAHETRKGVVGSSAPSRKRQERGSPLQEISGPVTSTSRLSIHASTLAAVNKLYSILIFTFKNLGRELFAMKVD